MAITMNDGDNMRKITRKGRTTMATTTGQEELKERKSNTTKNMMV